MFVLNWLPQSSMGRFFGHVDQIFWDEECSCHTAFTFLAPIYVYEMTIIVVHQSLHCNRKLRILMVGDGWQSFEER